MGLTPLQLHWLYKKTRIFNFSDFSSALSEYKSCNIGTRPASALATRRGNSDDAIKTIENILNKANITDLVAGGIVDSGTDSLEAYSETVEKYVETYANYRNALVQNPNTPEPDSTTPEPDPTTPEPDPTTPEPDPTTPVQNFTTPANDSAASSVLSTFALQFVVILVFAFLS